ncbi:DUF2252 domain-containing protein [Ferruginibacter sp.]|uniref:DUF2252 domain-containing protein n=2 Tax=Ferruginibacter sp. TaxID=1940288 RepID=UPI00265A76CE|nr:DUF2252 family protein [Ferruginibacter sp.]
MQKVIKHLLYLLERMVMLPGRIKTFNSNRDPKKVLLKYATMKLDAFRFFRGTCHLFYEDLYKKNALPKSPNVWMCGDLHIENFGSFKGSDRLVYFDLNDFDEAILSPAAWEVSRLLCSVVVAARTAAYSKVHIQKLTTALLKGYAFRLQQGKGMTVETATGNGLIKTLLEKVETRKESKLLKQRTSKAYGYSRLQIDNLKSFAIHSSTKEEVLNAVKQLLKSKTSNRKWKALDAVYRVAGTGSIGIERYAVLVQDVITSKKLILDVKEAMNSSLQDYTGIHQPKWKNNGDRIIKIQTRMQFVCPSWLDTLCIKTKWFVIKEIQPVADGIEFISFKEEMDKQEKLLYTLGQLTASAQLRSSGREGSAITDALISFGTDVSWQKSVTNYAGKYALQVEKDYQEFCKAFDKGYFNSTN